jgi:hypothetical protein
MESDVMWNMNKKFRPCVLALQTGVLLLAASTAFAARGDSRFTGAPANVQPGGTFSVDFVFDLGSFILTSFEVAFDFNAAALQVTSISATSDAPGFGTTVAPGYPSPPTTGNNGEMKVVGASSQPNAAVTGEIALFRVTFQVANTASAGSNLSITLDAAKTQVAARPALGQASQAVSLGNHTAGRVTVQSNCTVPNVEGATQTSAESTLRTAGFTVSVQRQNDQNVPLNSVISQSPAPNASVTCGSAVTITVSDGPQTTNCTVPNVTGISEGAAGSALAADGFGVSVQRQNDPNVALNDVIQQSPGGGTSVACGSMVTIIVSNGPSGGGCNVPAPQNFEASQGVFFGAVELSWSVVNVAAAYRIYRTEIFPEAFENAQLVGETTETSFRDESVSAGFDYYVSCAGESTSVPRDAAPPGGCFSFDGFGTPLYAYWVVAVDASGCQSEPSAPASGTSGKQDSAAVVPKNFGDFLLLILLMGSLSLGYRFKRRFGPGGVAHLPPRP